MTQPFFAATTPNILGNDAIRTPQQETYQALRRHALQQPRSREVGIVLPVGCGKSGCITLAPFAYQSRRTLVIAPGLKIAQQLAADFDPSNSEMFYTKCNVLSGAFPEPVEIRGKTTNRGDLDAADVVITNVHQLQGDENRWLQTLPADYFDLILFDEGHHSVAATWELLKSRFPQAQVVNFSATPTRADGRQMAGEVLYTFSVARAIQDGYVKHLKALVLNPSTLRYVRRDGEREIEVTLEEVRQLGEVDADFRKSIVTSKETLDTIVDASIRELERIRAANGGDTRHKIIASALNFQHCHQIVAAYQERGRRAAFVHSREESKANERVLQKLENHELDVIVQVRKLNEGFDHRYLSVAAVFSIFANLSPFVQFVGRIMRVIEQNNAGSPRNQGTVVFHAGSNIAARWEDFQQYSEADQEYFQQLLPTEDLAFGSAAELTLDPTPGSRRSPNTVEVRAQSGLNLEEIPLLENNPEAMRAIEVLRGLGYGFEDVRRVMEHSPVPTTKARKRQAARSRLDSQVQNEAGKILARRGANPKGMDLDRTRTGRENFVVIKSCLDKHINRFVGVTTKKRHELNQAQLDQVEQSFAALSAAAEEEVFDGSR